MNESNSPPFPPQPSAAVVRTRKGLGCSSIGCLLVIVVLLLIGAGMGSVYWLFSHGGPAYVSEKVVPVRIAEASDEQYQAVLAKLAPFGQAMNEGHAATLEITPDDLNTLIARSPQFESWRGRVFLAAAHDRIIAEVSSPVTSDETTRGYFNVRATLDASYSGNGFVVFIRRLEPINHSEADTPFTHFLNTGFWLNLFSQEMSAGLSEGFREQAAKDPASADFLRSLRTIVVQDGKIVVTLNERPGGTPAVSPAPTPVATEADQT